MNKYFLDECSTCAHNQVCKHLSEFNKLQKLKLPVDIQAKDKCPEYMSTPFKHFMEDMTGATDNSLEYSYYSQNITPEEAVNQFNIMIESVIDFCDSGVQPSKIYMSEEFVEAVKEHIELTSGHAGVSQSMVPDELAIKVSGDSLIFIPIEVCQPDNDWIYLIIA